MYPEENELIPSFGKIIFSDNQDYFAEIGEIALDEFLDELPRLCEIPVIKSLQTCLQITQSIRERNAVEQFLYFLRGYCTGTISPADLQSHRDKLQKNPKQARRELGRVLTILDRSVEAQHSLCVGRFYASFISGSFTWADFCELTQANEKMFLNDYPLLHRIAQEINISGAPNELYRAERLCSLGLVRHASRLGQMTVAELAGDSPEIVDFEITHFGKLFCKYDGFIPS